MARQSVDHYLPLFGRDFLTATSGWTAEERGHYITLIIVQWEQGSLPNDTGRLELVSPGVGKVWAIVGEKFPVWPDGLRRNHRLEEHRQRSLELRESRSESGKSGNQKRWSDRKTIANGSQKVSQNDRKTIAKGIAKRSPPTPTPTPTPNPSQIQHTHTHTGAGEPGWAAGEWSRFVAAWNSTGRAEPWPHLTAPDGWADLAATPGWLERAREALEMLPSREYFDRPLPVTRFFDFVDRIRAGEFADAKLDRPRIRQPAGGNL